MKNFLRKYILAPLPILLIVLGATVLIVLGVKNIQIGGLIGKLLGRSEEGKSAVSKANAIPEDRVDNDGNLIPIGSPDSKGIAQVKVVPIKKPGLFDDPKKVVITDPTTKKEVSVSLPDGVKAKDVDQVVMVAPKVKAVTIKSESTVTAPDVDDLLSKYGDL